MEILPPRMNYAHEIVGIHEGALLPEQAHGAKPKSKTPCVLLPALRQLVVYFTYQEYTTMTNISIAARTVLPLPKPGARLELLEIKEPLGLHIWSEKNNNDLRSDQIIN